MDNNAEKVLKGIEWCIKADKASQCVFALTECPYVDDCSRFGRSVLLEDAYVLIKMLLKQASYNTKTDLFCMNCGRKVTTMFCRGCGRMVNWENDEG